MPLKGELADLSLAELIEFFCNQRKTGRLTVSYPHGPAYFYLQSGSVVHASIGSLRGIEAVYYALTQSNASFNFSTAYEAPCQTINQPWTSVVLEGLRRMDEGIKPRNPFPETESVTHKAAVKATEATVVTSPIVDASPAVAVPPASAFAPPAVVTPLAEQTAVVQAKPENVPTPIAPSPVHLTSRTAAPAVEPPMEIQAQAHRPESLVTNEISTETKDRVSVKAEEPQALPRSPKVSDAFLSPMHHDTRFSHRPWKVAAIFAALILVIAAIAVPWGWRVRGKAAKAAEQTAPAAGESSAQNPQSADVNSASQPESVTAATESPADANGSSPNSDAADAARREREARAREEARLRAKAADTSAATSVTQAQPAQPSSTTSPAPSSGPKKVVVQVTYDENGRVTQATGNDPTALRIARQKRFPPGKAGSATITIPIN